MLANASTISFSATAQPERALAFYRDALGLRLIEDSPFALVFDVGGKMLRVQKVEEVVEVGYTVLGWDVPDIRATVTELAARGVRFNRYEFLAQDELGIWVAPDGPRVAWFTDPDGNTLSLTQFS